MPDEIPIPEPIVVEPAPLIMGELPTKPDSIETTLERLKRLEAIIKVK